MPTARVSSAFFARQAAATAMAAETPQTEVAAAMMIVRVFDGIFSQRVPKSHMKTITIGVTTQATSRPGRPSWRISEKRISAPSRTSPVLMSISDFAPSRTQAGVPTVLAMRRPRPRAQIA